MSSKFNKTFNLVLESIFKGATREERKERRKIAPEILKKEWIEEFMKRSDVIKNPDGSYDVKGDVDLQDVDFKKFPIKFGKIYGEFFCNNTDIETLEDGPTYVEDSFWCTHNKLASLEHGPKQVGSHYIVSGNQLTSLKGIPQKIIGSVIVDNNKLTSLKDAPKSVSANFSWFNNLKNFTEEEIRKHIDVGGEVYAQRFNPYRKITTRL